MKDKWYLASDGKGFGPFSVDQLGQMAEAGVVDAEDVVWRAGDDESLPASTIEQLLSRESTPLSEKVAPPSSSKSRLPISAAIAAVILVMVGTAGWFAANGVWRARTTVAARELGDVTNAGKELSAQPDREEEGMPLTESPAVSNNVVVAGPNENVDQASGDSPAQSSRGDEKETTSAGLSRARTTSAPRGRVATGNVALSSNGSSVNKGIRNPWAINDGKSSESWREYAKAALNQPVVVKLDSTYELQSVRVQLVGNDGYRYFLEVSEDGDSYEIVQDRRRSGLWTGWQGVTFAARPVQYIRLTGTYDNPNQSGIRVGEIEAYCTK